MGVILMQVSLAKFGAGCAPLPAAVLGTVHNFTAAQRLLAEGTPSDGGIVLAAYAAHAAEQFETAKRAYKKARLPFFKEAGLHIPDLHIVLLN
jgi:hypothetical protein